MAVAPPPSSSAAFSLPARASSLPASSLLLAPPPSPPLPSCSRLLTQAPHPGQPNSVRANRSDTDLAVRRSHGGEPGAGRTRKAFKFKFLPGEERLGRPRRPARLTCPARHGTSTARPKLSRLGPGGRRSELRCPGRSSRPPATRTLARAGPGGERRAAVKLPFSGSCRVFRDPAVSPQSRRRFLRVAAAPMVPKSNDRDEVRSPAQDWYGLVKMPDAVRFSRILSRFHGQDFRLCSIVH
jgi:hypothetical protein